MITYIKRMLQTRRFWCFVVLFSAIGAMNFWVGRTTFQPTNLAVKVENRQAFLYYVGGPEGTKWYPVEQTKAKIHSFVPVNGLCFVVHTDGKAMVMSHHDLAERTIFEATGRPVKIPKDIVDD